MRTFKRNFFSLKSFLICFFLFSFLPAQYTTDDLIRAVWSNRADLVSNILENGVPADALATNGMTALHLAAYLGSSNIAMSLLKAKANTSLKSSNGMTALHFALNRPSVGLFKILIDAKVPLNTKVPTTTQSVLRSVTERRQLPLIQMLLDAGADPNSIDRNGVSPLYSLIAGLSVQNITNTFDIAKVLLKAGADINLSENGDDTVLLIATRKNSLPMIKFLIANGAAVDQCNNNGQGALFTAVQQGQKEIVEYLISQKANVNASLRNGQSPLEVATQRKNEEIIEMLKKAGAKDF